MWVGLWHIAPHAIVTPARKGAGLHPPDGMFARSFAVSPELTLKAWIAEPAREPSAVVIVLHGIADSKASQAGNIAYLAARGIVGIAVDLRAQGESGGQFATYGYHEKSDMVRLFELLSADYPGLPIGLWGTSYGGAVALQAAAQDSRFAFVIIESTFADLADVVADYAFQFASIPVRMFSDAALRRAGALANFSPGEVRPAEAIKRISVPILHLHGSSDPKISLAHAARITAQTQRRDYRFVAIEKGTHFNLQAADRKTYFEAMDAFLRSVTAPEPSARSVRVSEAR